MPGAAQGKSVGPTATDRGQEVELGGLPPQPPSPIGRTTKLGAFRVSPALQSRDTRRIEAFSDGVLAIAITLLLLNLDVVHGSRNQNLLAALGDQWPSFAAYLASFAFVGVVWVSQLWLYERIAAADSGILWRNLRSCWRRRPCRFLLPSLRGTSPGRAGSFRAET